MTSSDLQWYDLELGEMWTVKKDKIERPRKREPVLKCTISPKLDGFELNGYFHERGRFVKIVDCLSS